MKASIIILFLLLFLINGCDNPVEHNNSKLQVSFKNNSSYELSNLLVANRLIGTLPGNSSSKYIAFDSFDFDTGMPDEDASTEVNGRMLTNHSRGFWCGTEKITIDSGKFLIEIEVLDTLLYLSCRNAPTID